MRRDGAAACLGAAMLVQSAPPMTIPTTTSTTDAHAALTTLLATHDAPCPTCRHNLRGCPSFACPECGSAFTFDDLVRPRRWCSVAWAVLLAAWATALPWSVLGVWQRLVFRRKLFYGRYEYDAAAADSFAVDTSWANPWFLLSSAFWLGVPIVVVLIVLLRRRIERWPACARWVTALVSAGLIVLAFRRWQWWYYDLWPNAPMVDGFWYLFPGSR